MKYVILLLFLVYLCGATVEIAQQRQLRESIPCFDDAQANDNDEGLNAWASSKVR